MICTKFELYKIKREIKRQGIQFDFYRFEKNDFGEIDASGTPTFIHSIKGLYHEFTAHMTDTYIVMTGTETATTRTKKTPQCMCLYDDVLFTNSSGEQDHIKEGDYVKYNDRLLRVSGISNIQEWNTIVDIAFEEIDDGGDIYT